MGKKWSRKIKENDGGTELEVKEDSNPSGRHDPPNEITVFVNEDLSADIEYKAQGPLKFVGPDLDPNGNTSVIWKPGSETLPWTLHNDKKLSIQDDDKDEPKDFNYKIGAYDKDGKWLLTPDPEIRNRKK